MQKAVLKIWERIKILIQNYGKVIAVEKICVCKILCVAAPTMDHFQLERNWDWNFPFTSHISLSVCVNISYLHEFLPTLSSPADPVYAHVACIIIVCQGYYRLIWKSRKMERTRRRHNVGCVFLERESEKITRFCTYYSNVT